MSNPSEGQAIQRENETGSGRPTPNQTVTKCERSYGGGKPGAAGAWRGPYTA